MSQSNLRSLLKLIEASWDATQKERLRFFTFIIFFVLAYTIDLIVPWTVGYILGVFVKMGFTEQAYTQAIWGLLAYVGLRLINTFLHHCARYLQNTVAYSARMHMLAKLFDTYMFFPLRWHVDHHSGENLGRLHRSVGAIDSTIGVYVWQVVEGTVKIAFASIAIFALDFWVALNVVGMGVVTVLLMILFNKRITRYIRQNNAFYDKINRICVDYLYNIVTVKTLRLEGAATQYLTNHRGNGLDISQRISRYTEMKWGSVSVGYSLVMGSSLLIYFYGHRGFAGALDVAQVYVLMNYLDKIFQAIGSFTGYYSGLIEASTAYEDADKILTEAQSLKHVPSTLTISPWKKFSIRNLNFSYVSGEQTGLKNLNLEINRGDKIALVGPSGGGKSTFLKILAGMLSVQSCEISSDQQDNLTLEDLAGISLLLPQEPEIFSETVRYNLSMGESIQPENMQFLASLCKMDRIIEKLPQGWDSNLAEKGLNLSVGEKQRVAMVRGLLRAKDKAILLLDEPTSSLDPMTEKAIFQGILGHFADRTIITACHRLALVPLFDKIIYIRAGVVEEMGSFTQLLESKGAFYQAWDDYQKRVVKESRDD